jgi:pimeloyl-ACP methyl ester carboxylesterase
MPTAEDFRQMREAYDRLTPGPGPGDFDFLAARGGQAGSRGWTAAELGRISAPTMLVFGDHDFFRLEHAVEMHALIPGAQLAVLPGATHMGLMRRADLMIPLVRDFLG